MKLAILIPYYQKQPGILRRALETIRQQRLPQNLTVDVIIVDDGSPVPPAPELADLDFPAAIRPVLVKQANAGVSRARNAGLGRIAADTDYVALLDSDDLLDPDYIGSAVALLERGHDLWFCNTLRLGEPHSVFAAKGFDRFLASPVARSIGPDEYELDQPALLDQALRGRALRFPGIVYRYAAAADLTFDPTLKLVGEDCLFIFQLITRCRRCCCTSRLLGSLADGVNIYASQQDWSRPGHLATHMGYLLAFYRWLAVLPLTAANQSFLKKRIRDMRRLFAFLTIRYFLKYRKGWPPELVGLTRQDPLFKLWYMPACFYAGLGYALKFYDPFKQW